jgi:hypothetical protein
MIHSASSSPDSGRPDPFAVAGQFAGIRPVRLPPDKLHTAQVNALRESLGLVPEIRPEVVARARALAADPAYPSDRIIRHVSAAIVNSPDLSEDHS